jgi:hypothetical protein
MFIELRHITSIKDLDIPPPEKIDGNVYVSSRLSWEDACALKEKGYRVIYEDKDYPGLVNKWRIP